MARTRKGSSARLRAMFRECGYIRWQNQELVDAYGPQVYKKGSEVRLVFETEDELEEVQSLIRQVGFYPAKPFMKHSRWVQPIYSLEAVEWFLGTGSGRSE